MTKCTPDGTRLMMLLPNGAVLTDPAAMDAAAGATREPTARQQGGIFNRPTDCCVHPETGDVFVSDGYGNSRVVVYSYDGQYLREWGRFGTRPGEFIVPHSITIDAARDRVYVADRENGRVQIFDTSGKFVSQLLSGAIHDYRVRHYSEFTYFYHHLSSVEYHPGLDVLAVLEGNTLTIRDPDGCIIQQHAASDYWEDWPHDMEVASDGAGGAVLYIAELKGNRMTRIAVPAEEIGRRRARRRD